MKLSHKARYAVTAMVDLALRQPAGPVALADLADSEGVSLSYLEQLFASLRGHGLVTGTRGPGGGYRLGRDAAAISVADIVDAVDAAPEARASSADAQCLTHELWSDLSEEIHGFLDGISLQELAEQDAVRAAVAYS